MNYTTQIDTISIQIDYDTDKEQRDLLFSLIEYTRNLGLFINTKDYSIYTNMIRKEHFIYTNNITLASINTGIFRSGSSKDGYKMQYYISIKFAGLKSYNELFDQTSNGYLLQICAFLNSKRIPFKLTELDVCIDMACSHEHVSAICTRKSPKTNYYSLDEHQAYNGTTYIEKIPSCRFDQAVLRTYIYDKSTKEHLLYPLTRFEIKLQAKYFNKYSFDTTAIAKAFDRYYVMYFETVAEKNAMIQAYNGYLHVRRREIKKLGLDRYRVYPNLEYINHFINRLLTIKE